jgi:hypothetical protein
MFTTRNPSETIAAGSIGRGDAAYGPSSGDSSTRRDKQNDLWMDLNRPRKAIWRTPDSSPAMHDKIKVDRRRFNG